MTTRLGDEGLCILRVILAVLTPLCIGAVLRAQIPTSYAPSGYSSLPADPNNGIPSPPAPLSPSECGVVDRMLAAAEEYVRTNPEYAGQLTRFRECYYLDRIRRCPIDTGAWRTLPDFMRTDGGMSRWIEPGGRAPSGGWIMPPNTLLAADGQIDGPDPKCDPNEGCFNRAKAIVVVIHEGFRQGNIGIASSESGLECSLILNAIATYNADLKMWADFIMNGVPVPGASNCTFTPDEDLKANEQMVIATVFMQEMCAEAQAKGCPVPPECGNV